MGQPACCGDEKPVVVPFDGRKWNSVKVLDSEAGSPVCKDGEAVMRYHYGDKSLLMLITSASAKGELRCYWP